MSNAPYRILALDGGGIRGIMTLELLLAIEQRIGPSFLASIDLMAGTSTGGLIALALASGAVNLTQLRDQYVTNGPPIFASALSGYPKLVKNLFTARYDSAALKKFVINVVGDKTLGDLRQKVLITSFDLSNGGQAGRGWKAKFFHNLPGADNGPGLANSDWNRRVADIALYTAVPPIYFPAIDGFVDGGVVAPNPSMVALAQTQDPRYFSVANPVHPARQARATRSVDSPAAPLPAAPTLPTGVRLLSLGTGQLPSSLARSPKLSWGFLQWIWPFSKPRSPLLNLMIDGDTEVDAYQCTQLLDDNFRRLQIMLGPNQDFDLDNADQIGPMQSIARAFTQTAEFAAVVDWIAQKW